MALKKLFRRKPQEIETAKSIDKRIVEKLLYKYYLTLEQLRNSDIPDRNLRNVDFSGLKNAREESNKSTYVLRNGYNFIFVPPRDEPLMNNYIHIIGHARKLSDEPERWEKNFEGLEDMTHRLHKITNGRIEDLYKEENRSNAYCSVDSFIMEPEMEMTQRGIADMCNRMKDEIGFKLSGISSVLYYDVVPKDPSAYGMGFNMPKNAIRLKTWKR